MPEVYFVVLCLVRVSGVNTFSSVGRFALPSSEFWNLFYP